MAYVPNLRFNFEDDYTTYQLHQFASRVTRKNKNNESLLPLTISAQYGLVDQISFFNKSVASSDLSNYYLLQNGEFAYNKSYSNDYPWGAIKRLDRYDKGCLSTLYICFKPNESLVDTDYLVHYFESPKWYKQVSDIAGEGARNHGLLNIAVRDFFLTKHKFPSLEEQGKVADLLNKIQERIEAQNKIIEDLKLLKDSIIDYLYNHNGGLEYKFKDLYTKAKEGGTPSTTVTSYYKNGQIPFIKIDDLNSKYIIHNQTYITNEGMKNSSAWLIPINSVILSNGATIGVTSINTYPVTTKQGILGIIPSKLVNYEYLYYLLNTSVFKKNLKKITTKGTMECAYIKDIDNIILRVPTLDVQLKSVKILNSLDKRLAIENNMINEYKDQKIYLLRNLFI